MFKADYLKLWLAIIVVSVAIPSQVCALTDPTQPVQYRAATKRVNLNLESILFSEARRVAVINGKALQEGEKLGSARVISIGKDVVRVQQQGKTYDLKLQRPTIRQEN